LSILLYIVIVLAAIIVLVVVHEFGHFIAAKKAGVKVTEFFVGFGPRIWSFRKGDTEYGFKWLPIGGYVKVLGMNPDETVPPEDFPHSYKGVSYGKRFWIIISGSLMHIILAVFIIFFTVWVIGIPKVTNTIAQVEQYLTDNTETPAFIAGVQPGDTIIEANGQPINSWDDLSNFIIDHPGQQVDLLVQRDGQQVDIMAQLAQLDNGNGFLGVTPQGVTQKYSFPASFAQSVRQFGTLSYGVFYGIGHIFTLSTFKQLLGITPPNSSRPVSVVGISRVAGQLANQGAYPFLSFFAFILLFLAYINLLPLPPLDGGHLLVIAIEKFSGKEVDMRKLYPVAMAVLLFFGILFILTLRLDITNPINLP
jgi:membrane-associated protease RseP (regulator of RpoE activity)